MPWPPEPLQEPKIPAKLFEHSPAYWDGTEWPLPAARAALDAITRMLDGCGDRMAAVFIDKILDRYGLPQNWESQAHEYLDEIAKIPPDLLEKMNATLRRTCKFFPMIPDLLETVADDIAKREFRRMKINSYLARHG